MTLQKKLNILLTAIFILCAVGVLYTFLQPRYTATIVSVGKARTISTYNKHRRRSHTVVPLVVTFTDREGVEQTVDATYRWASESLTVGQQIEIVKSFNGWIRYPFLGLRMFCGFVGGGIGLYLFFMILDIAEKRKTLLSARKRT